ncbi:MAG: YncE family protein [Solirubrobacteraceae bacterium]
MRSRRSPRVLVALEGANEVAVLSAGPRWRVMRRVRVAAGPHNLTASRALGLVAETCPPADRVTVLGVAGRVVAAARVSGAPHDAAFVAGRHILWISAEAAGRLVALDPRTGRTLRTVPAGGRPHDLAVAPDGQRLWVTIDGSDAVEIRDAISSRLLRRAALGGAPHDVAFAPDGRQVWLSNVGSPLLTLASAAGRRVGVLRAGSEPHHFAFGLGRLWASDNGGGALLRIGPGRRRVLGRTLVGPAPHHVAIAGRDVLVAVHGTGKVAVVSPSGRLRYLVRVGAGPHASTRCPATDRSKDPSASARRRCAA